MEPRRVYTPPLHLPGRYAGILDSKLFTAAAGMATLIPKEGSVTVERRVHHQETGLYDPLHVVEVRVHFVQGVAGLEYQVVNSPLHVGDLLCVHFSTPPVFVF